MTVQSKSIALSIGAAIGKGAAYAVHGAIAGAQASGRFGQDVAAGAQEGYATKSVELARKRAEALAQYEASKAQPVAVKPQPQLAAPAPAPAKRSRKVAA